MKIIIVGASGRIGREILRLLSGHHDIVRVGVRSGDVHCDYTDSQSIRVMFEKIGRFDSLISVAGGDSIFKSYPDLDDRVDDKHRVYTPALKAPCPESNFLQ
jgi:dTDP-4-dehydrorhamnose reductase